MAQRKNPELDAKHQAILKKMMQIPENKTCADCKGPSPRWASTNLGIFLCISCSGIHRKLGTHISQVRSVTLDTWTPAQIAHFTKFGNARAAQYFEACIPPNFRRPPHGDSMQMERFIRDKYENKRYITVENGGQGGGSTDPSYRTNVGSSYGGGLGPRPSQVPGTVSHIQAAHRTGSSYSSYAGRFHSGSDSLFGGSSGFSQTRRTGGMAHAASAIGSRPGNAIQRAGTMKELINMGFSPQHAARAVEATEGDLQKAVDWVLEHNDEGSRSNASSYATPPPQRLEKDLLDFDDPAPIPQGSTRQRSPDQARPKAMDSEVLMSTSKTTVLSKSADEQADFADFGAFESALPAMKEQSSSSSSVAANGSLSSKIRNIYKQSPPLRAQPSLKGMPHMANLDQPKQAGSPQSPIRTRPSPKLMAQKATEAKKHIPATDLGITSFTGLAKSQFKLSSPTTDAHPLRHPNSHGVKPIDLNGGVTPPPPPPPQVGVSASTSIQESGSPAPPPPNSPPPTEQIPIGQAKPSLSDSQPVVDQSPHNQDQDEGGKTVVNATEQSTPQEEEEEEDPFAMLSMMAMSSAKAKSKKRNPAPPVNLPSAPGGPPGIPEQGERHIENTATANAGIDLDELLG